MFHRSIVATALVLCGVAAFAQSADASRITRVVVYPGVASVERTARVAAGARSATFACLPAGLDANALQVTADASVRVGELSVKTLERELAPQCLSAQDAPVRALEDQIAQVRAELDAQVLVQGYLKSVTGGGDKQATAHSGSQIDATVGALSRNATAAAKRQQVLQRQIEALERQLKPLVVERDRAGAASGPVSLVTVNLAAEREADIKLIYSVRGPGWQPSYRATLDSANVSGKATVRLERQALVAQSSGEDWTGVPLVLSTGQPTRNTTGPLPPPWTLAVAPPPPPPGAVNEMRLMAAAPAVAPAPMAMRAMKTDATPMPNFDVSVFDRGFATEFVVPQRVTVPSNGQRVTLALGSTTTPAKLAARTTPAQEPAAYLVAEIDAPSGVWPAGPVTLVRDGAMVGTGRFDPSQPAGLTLSFGRDELIAVRAEPVQDAVSTAGFTGSQTERRIERNFVVENRHKTAMPVQVLDAAPVSRDGQITVESRYEPAPATTAWNKQPGAVQWTQTLPAGATARFTARHNVRYPKDARIIERQY